MKSTVLTAKMATAMKADLGIPWEKLGKMSRYIIFINFSFIHQIYKIAWPHILVIFIKKI